MATKYILALSALLTAGSLQAQDIYKVEALTGTDLNGTARFVGMGGAMSALGADLSTMGQNPAGIALYRRSDLSFTFGVTSQPNGISFADIKKARPSFDQAGFVYAGRLDNDNVPFVNFGFNYQKRRNFKNTVDIASHPTGGLSQAWQLMDLAWVGGRNGWLDLDIDEDRALTTPLGAVGYDTGLIDKTYDSEGKLNGYAPVNSNDYFYRRAQWGGIEQYDFNVSTNIKEQFYVGATIGVYNVNMRSHTLYGEGIDFGPGDSRDYFLNNTETLDGTGVDFKVGTIIRPLADSPLRLGFAVSSPIFYKLTQRSYLYMQTPLGYDIGLEQEIAEQDVETGDNDYRIRTPWRVNVSLATTVGSTLAINAEYEIARYTGASISYPGYDDYGESPWESYWGSDKDHALNDEIDQHMKPVSTFRVGAEARISPRVSLRVGYNHVTAPFGKSAFLNLFTASPSYYFSTNTDYLNLGAINRATAGLGYRGKHFYADFAYQYQQQKADVYAFHIPTDNGVTNQLGAHSVDLNRHNAMLTLGWKF